MNTLDHYVHHQQLGIVQAETSGRHEQERVGQYCLRRKSNCGGHYYVDYATEVNVVLTHVRPEYFLDEWCDALGSRRRRCLHPDDRRVHQYLDEHGDERSQTVRLDGGGVMRTQYRAFLLVQMAEDREYQDAFYLAFGWARRPLERCWEGLQRVAPMECYEYALRMTVTKPVGSKYYLPVFHVDHAVSLRADEGYAGLHRRAAAHARKVRELRWGPAQPSPSVTRLPNPKAGPSAPGARAVTASGGAGDAFRSPQWKTVVPGVQPAPAPVPSATPVPAAPMSSEVRHSCAGAVESRFVRRVFAPELSAPAEAFSRAKRCRNSESADSSELDAARKAVFAAVERIVGAVGLPDVERAEWASWLGRMPPTGESMPNLGPTSRPTEKPRRVAIKGQRRTFRLGAAKPG